MFYSEEIYYSFMLICNHHFNMVLLQVLNKKRYKAFFPYFILDERWTNFGVWQLKMVKCYNMNVQWVIFLLNNFKCIIETKWICSIEFNNYTRNTVTNRYHTAIHLYLFFENIPKIYSTYFKWQMKIHYIFFQIIWHLHDRYEHKNF